MGLGRVCFISELMPGMGWSGAQCAVRRLSEAAQAITVSACCWSSVGLGAHPRSHPKACSHRCRDAQQGAGTELMPGWAPGAGPSLGGPMANRSRSCSTTPSLFLSCFSPNGPFAPLQSRIRAKPSVSSGGTRHPSASWAHQSLAVPFQQQLPSPGAMLVPPREDHGGMQPSPVARAGPSW